MRGGNRQIALIGLEALAIAFLLSLLIRTAMAWRRQPQCGRSGWGRASALAILLLSPAWLGLVYLVPMPGAFWASLPGREIYTRLLGDAGIATDAWLPLSLVPDATKASLLAGLPLMAGFLAGYLCRLQQLNLLLGTVVAMAMLQVLVGLLQVAGGSLSSLFVGGDGGRPIGTFANANHFANYVAMATAAYVLLGWNSPARPSTGSNSASRFDVTHLKALWIAGGVFLVLGILLSRSRGAAFTGLPAAMLAVGVVVLTGEGSLSWRRTLVLIAGVLLGAVALVGVGSFLSRFDLQTLSSSAEFRDLLASSTLRGAIEFWPWGAGWGSYAAVYPRFQPAAIAGYADHAHQDYVQLLFEGGVFSLILGTAFLWLAATRAWQLTESVVRRRVFNQDQLAAGLCGLGLLGFLLHSLVEFNMHIPANAILAALLAGAYLRPLAKSPSPQ